MILEVIDTRRKALKINLDENIYGTFAEIGAGQRALRLCRPQRRQPYAGNRR